MTTSASSSSTMAGRSAWPPERETALGAVGRDGACVVLFSGLGHGSDETRTENPLSARSVALLIAARPTASTGTFPRSL